MTVSASEAYSQRNVRMSVDESLAQVGAIRSRRRRRPARRRGRLVRLRLAVRGRHRSRPRGGARATALATAGRPALTYRRHDRHGHAPAGARPARRDRHRRRAAPARHPRHGAGQRLRRPAGGRPPVRHRGGRPGRLAVRGRRRRQPGHRGPGPPAATTSASTTGIDLEALLAVSSQVADAVGHPVPSRIAAAGPRWKT